LDIGKYSRALVISANIVFEKENPTQKNTITIIHEAADGEVLDTHIVEDDTTGMVGNLAISTIHDEVQPGQRIVVIWTPRRERITFNNFHVFNTATAEPSGVELDFTNPGPFERTIDASSFPTGTQQVILTLTAQGAGGGGGGGAETIIITSPPPPPITVEKVNPGGGGGGGGSGFSTATPPPSYNINIGQFPLTIRGSVGRGGHGGEQDNDGQGSPGILGEPTSVSVEDNNSSIIAALILPGGQGGLGGVTTDSFPVGGNGGDGQFGGGGGGGNSQGGGSADNMPSGEDGDDVVGNGGSGAPIGRAGTGGIADSLPTGGGGGGGGGSGGGNGGNISAVENGGNGGFGAGGGGGQGGSVIFPAGPADPPVVNSPGNGGAGGNGRISINIVPQS
jgi:hypothetical protein